MRRVLVLAVLAVSGLVLAGCGSLVGAGSNLTCVVLPDGAPNCFGGNADGQAGHSAGTSPAAPGAVQLPKGWGVADLAVGKGDPDGDATVCAATGKRGAARNVVRCWGDDDHGQLGRGAAGAASAAPVAVDLGGGGADTVGVGAFSACALTEAVYCWGDNTHGQLGTATPGIAGPAPVPGTSKYRSSDGQTSTPVLLAVGELHVCAGIASAITCWGQGTSGQLGNGQAADSATPVKLAFPKGMKTVGAISAGGAFTCATFDADGFDVQRGAWCWGANESGQLGDGTTTASAVPVKVQLPDGAEPNQISAGRAHACVVDRASAVWCWGQNGQGQLGNGTTTNSATPVRVPGVAATLIAAGVDHTCASTTKGRLRCWGANALGQLGIAAGGPSAAPLTVPGIDGLRAPAKKGVRVTGAARVGGTLAATTPAWPYAASYGYEWQRRTEEGWEAIRGAEARTLRVRAALAGASVRVVVSGRNAWTETAVVETPSATSRAVTVAG